MGGRGNSRAQPSVRRLFLLANPKGLNMTRTEAIRHALTAVLVRKRVLELEKKDPQNHALVDQYDLDINRYSSTARVLNKMLKRRTA